MKNTIKYTLIIIVVLFILPGIQSMIETHYTREGVVIQVINDEVTVLDNSGNEWIFEGKDFHKGNHVIMKMFNANTDDTIYDDVITSVKVSW